MAYVLISKQCSSTITQLLSIVACTYVMCVVCMCVVCKCVVCMCVFVNEIFLLCTLGGVTVLAEQDLHILTEIVRSATPQWRTIGGCLGLLHSDLTIIQQSPLLIQEGAIGYFREMLSQWLKWAPPNHPLPTLEALVVALRTSGHESLAVNLKSLFLQRKGWFV